MSDKKMRVGDKLYIVSTKSKGRHGWCKVVKVGRKYFYIASDFFPEWQETRFEIKGWRHDHGNMGSPSYDLYSSKDDFDNTRMANSAARSISDMFTYYDRNKSVTNEQVFLIADILNIELKEG